MLLAISSVMPTRVALRFKSRFYPGWVGYARAVTSLFQSRRIFLGIVAIGLFAMAVRSATDPDLWWHLRTGQLILQNHAVFHTDPYSFTRAGQAWVNHEWLSEVSMFSLYQTMGDAGLIIAFAGLTAVGYLFLLKRCPGRPEIAAAVTVWGAIAYPSLWGARPQVLSFLLASICLYLLEHSSKRPLLLLWLPAITLLWVNLHAGYAAGLALVLITLAGDLLDFFFGSNPRRPDVQRLKWLGITAVGCLALVPVNPNGVRMYGYPLETLRSAAMQKHIVEWFSPNFHQPENWPLLLLLCALLITLTIPGVLLRTQQILLLLTTAFAALVSVRHIPIFVLVAVPIVCEKLTGWFAVRNDPPAPPRKYRTLLNTGALVLFLVFTFVRTRSVIARQRGAEMKTFPSQAVSFVSTHHLPGPLLNHYNWGGYFIWKLYPEYRVYIDGRADLYEADLMNEFDNVVFLRDGWDTCLKRWQIRTIVLPPGSPLIVALRRQPGWTEVYLDSQAAILTR